MGIQNSLLQRGWESVGDFISIGAEILYRRGSWQNLPLVKTDACFKIE
jgi:hypothetical protein